MSHIPWIFIVSTPRSGTNYTLNLLNFFVGISNFYELFYPPFPTYLNPETLAIFQRVTGLDISEQQDPRLGEWIGQNRARTLEILQETAPSGTRATCVKIFSDHMDQDSFQRLLVDLPQARFLFVKRSPIDSFISLVKAKQRRIWLGVDTTKDRVRLDADDFAEWHQRQSHWFGFTDQAVRIAGRPRAELIYEQDLLTSERISMARIEACLDQLGVKTRAHQNRLMKRTIKRTANRMARAVKRPPLFKGWIGPMRQDLALSRNAKVSNWDEFVSDIEKLPDGFRQLDAYFVQD